MCLSDWGCIHCLPVLSCLRGRGMSVHWGCWELSLVTQLEAENIQIFKHKTHFSGFFYFIKNVKLFD